MMQDTGPLFRDPVLTGLEKAERLLGTPVRLDLARPLPKSGGPARHPFGHTRRAEIIMVLPRPEGVLLHTKAFYPPEVLRLPSGGIHPGEEVLDAARREVREETGLRLSPGRFLFHLIQHHAQGGRKRHFHSLGLLFPATREPLVPEDPTEAITDFRAVPWERIPEIARILETLEPSWAVWGLFRAAPHRLLLQVRQEHPAWFDPAEEPPASP